jgi:serine/threonine-protein kinase
MLYEMVTGQMPFTADTPIAVIMKHMNTPPMPPSKLAPSIPKGLEQIILCAMDKNPKNRYQSAAQMLRHLRRLKMDESTLFNISKPAPKTHTSEVTIEKTTIHSGPEEKQKSPYDVDELPPVHQPKQPVHTPKKPAHAAETPPGMTKKKYPTPSIPAEKSTLTPEPVPYMPQKPAQPAQPKQAQPKPAQPKQAQPKKSAQQRKPAQTQKTAPSKRKKKSPSLTTLLILIIICLIIAIVATISLMGSMGSADDPALVVELIQTQDFLLYLRQVVL